MVHGCVVFSYAVTIVGWSRSPVMVKLLLLFLASHPVETRVHGFGPSWVNGVVGDSEGHGVVGLHCRRWLRMAHRNERVADRDVFTVIDIEGTKLSLCNVLHDGFDDLVVREDIPIVGWVAGVVGKGEMAANAAVRLGFR